MYSNYGDIAPKHASTLITYTDITRYIKYNTDNNNGTYV